MTMSRNPIPIEKEDKKASKELERHVNFVISEGMFDAVTLEEIKSESAKKDMND